MIEILRHRILHKKAAQGQGLVEFALVLPVLILLIIGIMEFGYFFFCYSTVNTAAREAVRYGAATGDSNTDGVPNYSDCPEIKDVAIRIGRYANIQDSDITIFYDDGPNDGTPNGVCDQVYEPELGERIVVQVHVTYHPIIFLLNLPDIDIDAESARTIITAAGWQLSGFYDKVVMMLGKQKAKMQSTRNRREKGQSLVEFAVSLVILMIILSGVIDLGRLFFYYIAMRDAVQEGVMYGIIEPEDPDEIDVRTRGLLSDNTGIIVTININGTDYAVGSTPAAADACSGNTIVVTVTDPSFPITMPFLASILGRNTITLETDVSGTILTPACP